MQELSKLNVGIVNGKEWIEQCDRLPGTLWKRVSIKKTSVAVRGKA